MNKASSIIDALDAIKAQLAQISTAGGYNTDPTIKRGWLQHIFRRHLRNPISFPVIAYRVEQSNPRMPPGNSTADDSVLILLDGAVLVKGDDAEDEAVDALLNLMKDMRRALVFDPDKPRLKYSKLELQDCPFDLPETGEEYAFFSQKILIKVDDQYA